MIGMYQDKIDKLTKENEALRHVARAAVNVWNAQEGGVDHTDGVKFARTMVVLRQKLFEAGIECGDISTTDCSPVDD